LPLETHHVDLVTLRSALTADAPPDVLTHKLRVLRWNEIGQSPSDQLGTIHADEAGKLAVRVQDHIAVHQHRLMNALAELGEQLGRVRGVVLVTRGGAREQLIDRGDERRHLGPIAAQLHPTRQAPINGKALQLLR
jgi:hypothetical protein